MPDYGFHFGQPIWLWGLLAPLAVLLWLLLTRVRAQRGPIHRYADPHLLPHLLVGQDGRTRRLPLLLLAIGGLLATLALVGFPGFAGFWSKDEILIS